MRAHFLSVALLPLLAAAGAQAQRAPTPVIVVTPGHPSPMGPPVVVVPGRYVPSPTMSPPAGEVVVSLPVCPPGVPCAPVCPPFGPCAPPPCVCATNGVIEMQEVQAQPVTYPAQPLSVVTDVGPVEPAPGSLQLAYTGAFDGRSILQGGALRFTGHLDDPWFIEVEIGGKASSDGIGEFQFVLGPRLMGALIPSVLRLYGTLATGIFIHAVDALNSWGIWPLQLGGGLELGAPLTDNWSIGGFIDVRGELRIPFERDPVSLGVTWSAGLALMWF